MIGEPMYRLQTQDVYHRSGDWFNRLDWSLQDNNWGVGLPVGTKNRQNWPLKQPLLADPQWKPSPDHIVTAKQRFLEMLKVRHLKQ